MGIRWFSFKLWLKEKLETKQGKIVAGCIVLAILLVIIIPVAVVAGSDDEDQLNNNDDDDDDDNVDPPQPGDDVPSVQRYSISGTSQIVVWTQPLSLLVTTSDTAAPTKSSDDSFSGSTIYLYGARHEYMAFKFIIGKTTGSQTIDVNDFEDLGDSQRIEIYQASFGSAGVEEDLTETTKGSSVAMSSSEPNVFWVDVYIPRDAEGSKSYTTTLEIGSNSINVNLYVFDFEIPDTFHFVSQLNIGTVNDDFMSLLWEHRMIPKACTGPNSGFKYGITWENSDNPDRCEKYYDEPDEPDIYSSGWVAKRYIGGDGWSSDNTRKQTVGMGFQFVDNNTPRPSEFCDVSRGSDHYGTSEYNAKWNAWLKGLEGYLIENDYIDQVYHYVQNEPQDDEDENLGNWLCRNSKENAPQLKIAISEEPKENLIKNGTSDECGYDYYIAHIRAYRKKYAYDRLAKEPNEEVWFYSLPQDPSETWVNPTVEGNPGLHERIWSWISWSLRARGYAYYNWGEYFNNNVPGVRAKLFRLSFIDYEYFYLANGGAHPTVTASNEVDDAVSSVAKNLNEWNRWEDDLIESLRRKLGQYVEKTRSDMPTLTLDTNKHARGTYNINFQNPSGSPTDDPLEVDGKTWIKQGWTEYDPDEGIGMLSENIDNSIIQYGSSSSGSNVLENSFVYDDYGRIGIFYFDIEPGKYTISVSVGFPGKGYANDPHNVRICGVVVVDDVITTTSNSIIKKSLEVDVYDGRISVTFGGYSELQENYSYTFLQYVTIEPA
ncbi:zinc finger protein constans-like [Anaeramoeba flamelloides]|uniref:Zinc finger protein constans-like n=1 Tax=Anaeramoeba flamelloides TaxID=1746091 RepID=A0ABQ8X856_9EUKA|nr:zinc finger protein constans-like [Anaeramoeba flamelloides]